ncbi:hypothetical protein NL676_002964 [Syzygium grande]|nr:hypothetical protein NL676_002964 [Syzygium grande]
MGEYSRAVAVISVRRVILGADGGLDERQYLAGKPAKVEKSSMDRLDAGMAFGCCYGHWRVGLERTKQGKD